MSDVVTDLRDAIALDRELTTMVESFADALHAMERRGWAVCAGLNTAEREYALKQAARLVGEDIAKLKHMSSLLRSLLREAGAL
jgi:hypothetical protein